MRRASKLKSSSKAHGLLYVPPALSEQIKEQEAGEKQNFAISCNTCRNQANDGHCKMYSATCRKTKEFYERKVDDS
jgi:hypothetical protein